MVKKLKQINMLSMTEIELDISAEICEFLWNF
jgi:hypothetical protein